MAGIPSSDDQEVVVTFGDQQKINTFANNNSLITDLQMEIKDKQTDLDNLKDADEELMLLDEGDNIKLGCHVGDVFWMETIPDAQSYVERQKTALESDIKDLKGKLESTNETQVNLKAQLYAAFGDKIQLEN